MPGGSPIGTCVKSFATCLPPPFNKPNNPVLAAPTVAAPAPAAFKKALRNKSTPLPFEKGTLWLSLSSASK